MIRRLIHLMLRATLELRYDYDATYLHEVIDASLPAYFKFGLFMVMAGHDGGAPRDALFAARLAATMSEDCGPCSQLNINMALKAGVSVDTLTALVVGDLAAAGDDAALGFAYGRAVATNAPEAAALANEVVEAWGEPARIGLAYAVATARVYPALKRGLGHGAVCARLQIGDRDIRVRTSA